VERILTPDERMRRAEERYYKNKGTSRLSVNEKPNFKSLKKLVIQIIICATIYGGFYFMQMANYVFAEDVLNRTEAVLSYNMDFNEIYNQIRNYINGLFLEDEAEEEYEEEDEEMEEYVEEDLQEEETPEVRNWWNVSRWDR